MFATNASGAASVRAKKLCFEIPGTNATVPAQVRYARKSRDCVTANMTFAAIACTRLAVYVMPGRSVVEIEYCLIVANRWTRLGMNTIGTSKKYFRLLSQFSVGANIVPSGIEISLLLLPIIVGRSVNIVFMAFACLR